MHVFRALTERESLVTFKLSEQEPARLNLLAKELKIKLENCLVCEKKNLGVHEKSGEH